MYHRIACGGQSRHVTTKFTNWSLLPLTLGLGASAFVIFDHLAGRGTAAIIGVVVTATGLALLFGLGLALRKGG